MNCDIKFKIEDENILYKNELAESFSKTNLETIEGLHKDRVKAYKMFSKELYNYLYGKKSLKRLIKLDAEVIIPRELNTFTLRGIERFFYDLTIIKSVKFIEE